MEFAKGLQKVVHNCRQNVTHEVGLAKQVWEEGHGCGCSYSFQGLPLDDMLACC